MIKTPAGDYILETGQLLLHGFLYRAASEVQDHLESGNAIRRLGAYLLSPADLKALRDALTTRLEQDGVD